MHLRTVSRVLVRVDEFRAATFHELEKRTARIEWGRWLAGALIAKGMLALALAIVLAVAGAVQGAVAGLGSREGVEVEGFEAVAVSYPSFERDLRSLLE